MYYSLAGIKKRIMDQLNSLAHIFYKRICIPLFAILLLLAGCSKSTTPSAQKAPDTSQTSSQIEASTNTSSVKITKDSVKNLSDDQLSKMAEEPTLNIDDLDLQDEDLTELVSIINNLDPTSDIPTSVDLKK